MFDYAVGLMQMAALLDSSGELSPVQHALGVCHVLGAGFSRACCKDYPVSEGFLVSDNNLEMGIRFGSQHDYDPFTSGLLDRLEEAYGDLVSVNIEDVMTDLYTRAFGLGGSWEWASESRHSVLSARRDYRGLLAYIADKLWALGRDGASCDLAKRFLALVRTQDSIVSLNYDLLIEKHLKRGEREAPHPKIAQMCCGLGPPSAAAADSPSGTLEYIGYGPGPGGVFVKLHGSADWYACANSECPWYAYMTPGWLTRNDSQDTRWGRCGVCGSGVEVAIVPPTHAKPFDRFPRIRLMWWRAYRALIHARRWTLVGTSLAPADFHLASLIRSSSRDSHAFGPTSNGGQICVVDRDPESAALVAERLYRLLAPQIKRQVSEGTVKITPFGGLSAYLQASEFSDSGRIDDNQDLTSDATSKQ